METLRDAITPHLFVTELRAIAADDLWMSMAYKRASLAIHFTWKPETAAVLKIVPQIEAKLAPFGARPHCSKVFTMGAGQVGPLYIQVRGLPRALQGVRSEGEVSEWVSAGASWVISHVNALNRRDFLGFAALATASPRFRCCLG